MPPSKFIVTTAITGTTIGGIVAMSAGFTWMWVLYVSTVAKQRTNE